MTNPFTLAFGSIPTQFISRPSQTNQIIDTFTADTPSTPIYMITGVRGSGKTVMLTSIAKQLADLDDWIAIELNPEKDLLSSLVSKLYNLEKVKPFFIKAKINVGYKTSSISIESNSPAIPDDILLEKMLQILKKQKKRLLITLDEATNNEHIKTFAHDFQILIRKEYDIFLIMTGLYENLYDLQNEKTLTFLYRAPKIVLDPLSMPKINQVYSTIFEIDEEKAREMTLLTQGYPFAFQVLGYLYWEKRNTAWSSLISEYDHYLADYVYDKIWHELTDMDRAILGELSKHSDYVKIQIIREAMNLSPGNFSQYREKLIRKGLVDISRYGYIKLILPRFKDYIINMLAYETY